MSRKKDDRLARRERSKRKHRSSLAWRMAWSVGVEKSACNLRCWCGADADEGSSESSQPTDPGVWMSLPVGGSMCSDVMAVPRDILTRVCRRR